MPHRMLIISPGCKPAELSIDFAHIDAIVGGVCDMVLLAGRHMQRGIALYFHDSGLLLGLPPNLVTKRGQLFVGTLVASAVDEQRETADLSDEDIGYVTAWVEDGKKVVSYEYEVPDPVIVTYKTEDHKGALAEAAAKAAITPGPRLARVCIL